MNGDVDLIEQINSKNFLDTEIGRYLRTLSQRFEPLVVVDILCYLRVYTELSMRAKGALMLRESGIDLPADPEVAEQFEELQALAQSIGKTGLLALAPFVYTDRRDQWHLRLLQQDNI